MSSKNPKKQMSSKELLFDSSKIESKIVSIENPRIDVEVRQISIGELESLRKKAKLNIQNPEENDMYPFLIWATIYCCYDPKTGEKLFEDTDYDRFTELSVNTPWFIKLSEEVGKIIGGSGGEIDARKK